MLLRLVALFLLVAMPALAAEWRTYDNARFGYLIELPPEFTATVYPANGDGLTLSPSDHSARLLVFGTYLIDGDFTSEAKTRLALTRADGWQISYSKLSSRNVSFSGIRQDRIIYVRGVALCGGGAAFFQMDYPKNEMQRYDAVVMRLVRSLRPTEKCVTGSRQVFRGFPSAG
jgi:hypothetical protein